MDRPQRLSLAVVAVLMIGASAHAGRITGGGSGGSSGLSAATADTDYLNTTGDSSTGQINLTSATVSAHLHVATATVTSTLTVQGNAFSVGTSTFVITSSSIGVRTTVPAGALDVNGVFQAGFGVNKATITYSGDFTSPSSVTASHFDSQSANFTRNVTATTGTITGSNFSVGFGTSAFRVIGSSVGVSTGIPQGLLDVDGTIRHAGGITSSGPGTNQVTGNARGLGANDFQVYRTAAAQVASGADSALLGGIRNTASGANSAVIGGIAGSAAGTEAVSLGGTSNSSGGIATLVAGGTDNQTAATYNYAAVLGGQSNIASGHYTGILAGDTNRTGPGANAVVVGGADNRANGAFSFAAGHLARAFHQGTFVWSHFNEGNTISDTTDQFLIGAQGGFKVKASSSIFVSPLAAGATVFQVFANSVDMGVQVGTGTVITNIFKSSFTFDFPSVPGVGTINFGFSTTDNSGGGAVAAGDVCWVEAPALEDDLSVGFGSATTVNAVLSIEFNNPSAIAVDPGLQLYRYGCMRSAP